MENEVLRASYRLNVRLCNMIGMAPVAYDSWLRGANGEISLNSRLLKLAFTDAAHTIYEVIKPIHDMRARRDELLRTLEYLNGK